MTSPKPTRRRSPRSTPLQVAPTCACGTGNATPTPHTCPHAEDLRGDVKTLCSCCAECTRACAEDI